MLMILIFIGKADTDAVSENFFLANFPNYVFNSVFVAVVGVILTVTVCSLAGYAFAKMDFKGNDKLFIF